MYVIPPLLFIHIPPYYVFCKFPFLFLRIVSDRGLLAKRGKSYSSQFGGLESAFSVLEKKKLQCHLGTAVPSNGEERETLI